jgi:hypothetical protein
MTKVMIMDRRFIVKSFLEKSIQCRHVDIEEGKIKGREREWQREEK